MEIGQRGSDSEGEKERVSEGTALRRKRHPRASDAKRRQMATERKSDQIQELLSRSEEIWGDGLR
ncbi:hypothetical protein NQZ68_011397 [Dissostichus eleginoides]|nr:hypothetical protein NQZ68_011397 [Dissostichus eleginoides]